jgi:hypothetical protein
MRCLHHMLESNAYIRCLNVCNNSPINTCMHCCTLVPACCCCCSVGRTSTVFVGDPDQLAPIGPGRPFAAVLAAGLWPSIDLKQIYRTAAGSSIITSAHAVNRGAVWGLVDGIWRALLRQLANL